jgi:hypothetical protein
MLQYKPHLIEVHVPVEAVDAATYRVYGVEYAYSATVSGQITPMTSSQSYDSTGVMVERPHQMMWDEGDIPQGALVGHGGRWFVARAGQQIWDAEPITAHRSIVLAEIDASAVEAAHAIA